MRHCNRPEHTFYSDEEPKNRTLLRQNELFSRYVQLLPSIINLRTEYLHLKLNNKVSESRNLKLLIFNKLLDFFNIMFEDHYLLYFDSHLEIEDNFVEYIFNKFEESFTDYLSPDEVEEMKKYITRKFLESKNVWPRIKSFKIVPWDSVFGPN